MTILGLFLVAFGAFAAGMEVGDRTTRPAQQGSYMPMAITAFVLGLLILV